ncbi:hypothetical protein BJ878DRAFT_46334 [Calycina marina]|uniref:Transmembrane protein 135 N-terminal domain-containing protein n=1 Tax=Calycina marina TaxID=1763456 RepID=A0A9P8CKB7_9HELO|nr:hypothetical protein BJ878DRAFT_46334 [Calycina marina]
MSPSPPPGRVSARLTTDPILKNALRYTISASEYESLHRYILSRSNVLKRNSPTVAKVEKIFDEKTPTGERYNDYNASAIRASARVFVASAAALKLWGIVGERFLGKEKGTKTPLWRHPNFRLSLSLSSILLLHRILFRFFTRLRAYLLADEAKPFRRRNKKISRTLTSNLAPAIGASLAGFMLAVYPTDQLRVTIAIYTLSRAAEFAYNHAEDEGWIWGKKERPWWWGSWLLYPVTCGQLLHAFVFDKDCFPAPFGAFILKNSPQYRHSRPTDYPANLQWPSAYEVTDKLGEMAKLHYPRFISPVLFPNSQTLPSTLNSISPITSSAHPLITSLTCATLHPSDPSCLRTYITYWIRTFPSLAKFFTAIFLLFSLPKYRSFYQDPINMLNKLAGRILGYSAFVSGSIGTSWAMICFFQQYIPKSFLATQRFFLGGAIGGLWAWIVRGEARGEFMYSARASIDSLWKVGRKRGWWRSVRGGDVGLFVASLMVINVIYERDARAVHSEVIRKGIGELRGEGLRDVVMEEKKRINEDSAAA